MNKKSFIVSLLMAALVIFGLDSCPSNKGPNEIPNARNSLDWEGVYIGTVTMSGNEHIANVRIRLDRDQTLEFNREYVDGYYVPLNFTAPFKWDDTGNIIIIDAMDMPVQYEIKKDKLIRLDENNYVLKKVH